MLEQYICFLNEKLNGEIDISLKKYIDTKVVPLYKNHDKGHDEKHALEVIDLSFKIGNLVKENVDSNILYASAAFHDVGLKYGRENHHIYSGKIVRKLKVLKNWFSDDEINTIAETCEDHRASNKNAPRTIYGKIVADADRSSMYSVERLFERTWYYRIENPGVKKSSDREIFEDMYSHMVNKFSEDTGYVKICLKETKILMRKEIEKLHKVVKDKNSAWKFFQKMRKNGQLKRS